MRWLVFILLMTSFVSAIDVDFDCPDEIYSGEEFECSLEVIDGDGEYDVKIDLDGERDSVVELWNDGNWKSGYYYLIDFVEDEDEVDIRLKISEEGDWDGDLKLRQGDKVEFFDIEIEVEEGLKQDVNNETILSNFTIENYSDNEPVIISLNGDIIEEVDELVYISKDAKIIDWLPYGFCLFLIFIIGVLLIDKF